MIRIRRARRGFTLLEIAVVAVVAGIVLLLLLRWVGSLMATSAATIDVGAAQRDVTYISEQLEGDFERAAGCDPYGLDGPIRNIDENRIDLYTPNGDVVDVVSWRYDPSSSTMQRAVTPGEEGSCELDVTDPEWRTVADQISATDGAAVFTGHKGGATISHDDPAMYPEEDLDCSGMQAERCLFDSVEVSYTIRTPGEDKAPFATSGTYEVNLSSSRLGS